MFQTEHLQEKWSPVLAHPDLPKIEDAYKRAVTTLILENQEKALREDRAFLSEAAPENATGTSIDNWDPILISLVRRSMPNLIAYDICGVQPMTGPTGLIFAMRSRKSSQTGAEMLVDEAQQDFSNQNAQGTTGGGDITDTATNPAVLNDSPSAGTYETATGMTTAQGEALGDNSSTNTFAEMAFSIEKHTVTAVTRALKAEYTMELAQDLKAIHGLDAETELQLAYAWRDSRDEAALHRLITAYMRLAISMAAKFKRYGAPMNDLVQEAGLGLMKAADKFDPDRGVRFSTYAVWWIKASVQDYVMRNWSMVRTGSTSSQKSLFFNMRRVQAQLEREAQQTGENLDKHQLNQLIATEVGVPLSDVEMMDGRLSGSDFSLNATQASDEEGREWIETLEDENARADLTVEEEHDQKRLADWIGVAMDALNAVSYTHLTLPTKRIV